jgi:cell division protein FtsL
MAFKCSCRRNHLNSGASVLNKREKVLIGLCVVLVLMLMCGVIYVRHFSANYCDETCRAFK